MPDHLRAAHVHRFLLITNLDDVRPKKVFRKLWRRSAALVRGRFIDKEDYGRFK
ncbi:hypothetical protein DSM3645_04795 [Blastopirellula marina DSM 3645]|uniref:Uncharacterized protein n=1 Tax=Blastopirellula marina DSM 3645 TaxID=314230 RepID=A4A1N3_9BACT|nr:hypothetical protein DSM3645_04795 [Blastopirellula marina DSM 3645]